MTEGYESNLYVEPYGNTDFKVGDDMKDFYEQAADDVIRKAEEGLDKAAAAAEAGMAGAEESPEEKAAKAAAAFFGDGEAEHQAEAEEECCCGNKAETEDGCCCKDEAETGDGCCCGKAETDKTGTAEETTEEHADQAAASGKDSSKDSKKKDPKDAKIEELTDRLKRSLAEFDNFRKRTEKEKAAMFDMGAKTILEKLLPTIDNFERALNTVPETDEAKAYAEGMDMIYRQLLKNLEDAGAKPMNCAGQPFDPNLHNAVMHVDDESLGENVVAEEFQKGYFYKDTVLRHSMVKVAN